MPVISKRTNPFSESLIRHMTRVANRTGAVNLSQGFPDFEPPSELLHSLQKVSMQGPHQYAVTWGAPDFRKALEFPETYYQLLTKSYEDKRTFFTGALDTAGLRYLMPQGAYYVLVDVAEFGVTNDRAFCEMLAEQIGVAAVPGSSFFKENINNFIRFHFAKKSDTLQLAASKLLLMRQKLLG